MTLRKSALKPSTTTLKRTSSSRVDRIESREVAKLRKVPVRKATLKTKQRAVSADEKALWDRLASEIGCVACMKDGRFNPHVSIHHVDGRTKPGCHQQVLPLCGPHHQNDGSGAIAVHPWKARFEARYGSQTELMALCMAILVKKGAQ